MKQPTELQAQAAAMSVIAELTRAAVLAGATSGPNWWISPSGIVSGDWTNTTAPGDDSELRALDVWRRVVGQHKATSYVYASSRGPRRAYSVEVTVAEVSIRLCASVPLPSLVEQAAAGQQVAA